PRRSPRRAWAGDSTEPSASVRPARRPSPRSSAPVSYVVHRPRGPAALERAGREIAESELVDDLRDRARDLVPQLGQIVALAGAPAGPALRLERRPGALDGAQDIAHRDVLGRARQVIAACRSASGREKPGPLQGEQHLLEVPLRDRLACGDALDGREAAV